MTTLASSINLKFMNAFAKGPKEVGPQNEILVKNSRPPIDIEQTAREDGSRNLPPQDATTLSETERAIVTQSMEAHNEAFKKAYEDSSAIIEKISTAQHAISATDVDAPTDKARTQIQEIHAVYRRRLLELYKTYILRKGALLKFKDENKLYREADFPESPLHHVALVIVIAFVESILNSWFYAKASDSGLIGGLGWSVAFSVANTGVSFILGWTARYKNHLNWKKTWGYTAVLAFIVVCFFLNQAIGHARDLMSEGVMPSGPMLYDAIKHHTWELSISGWILFAIGALIIAPLSFYKGYRSDDAYVGYKDETVATCKALEDFEEAIAHMHQEAGKVIDEAGPQCEELSRRVSQDFKVLTLAEVDGQHVLNQYRQGVDSASRNCRRQLELYREKNMQIRQAPAPVYFEDYSCCEINPRYIPGLGVVESEQDKNKEVGETRDAIISQIQINKRELLIWNKSMAEELQIQLEQIKVDALNPHLK